MITLANPAGLWALLGIPAVLAIHFLQRQAQVLPVSTLFLLEKTQRESASGRRFDRLMNSIPLWMQLLGVILLAWILAEPRYQKARSTQRVGIVLDSSASMSVFKDELISQLTESLPKLKGPATHLELTILDSNPSRERLYSGDSVENALAVLEAWNPQAGLTDPSPALRIARSLIGREGILVYATDTPVESPPYDTRLLSVGEKVENVGVTGVRFTQEEGADVWNAVIRNYGPAPASRTWQLKFPDGTSSEPRPFEVKGGGLISLQGALPKGRDRALFVLSEDRFVMDDVVPMVRPQPKAISLFSATSPDIAKLSERMVRSLESIIPSNDASTADFSLVSYDPLNPILPDGDAAVFVNDGTRAGAYLKGGIVAESHPLVDGLNWQALLVRESIQLERLATDDVLLWQGERPLIFLRELTDENNRPTGTQLCFNFDLRLSNAGQQPAFIVCLHRFIEDIRRRKVAEVRANLETGQPIEIAALTMQGEGSVPGLKLEHDSITGEPLATESLLAAPLVSIRAPATPGFLRIAQGEQELLNASLYFADTREADFTACDSVNTLDGVRAEAIQRHTQEDHWWRAWVLLLLAALVISWHFTKSAPAVSEIHGDSTSNPKPTA